MMRFLMTVLGRVLLIGCLVGALAGLLGGCTGEPTVDSDLASARKAYVERQYLEAERLYERYLKLRQRGKHRWEVWNRLVELAVNVRQDVKSATELLETMLLEYGDQQDKARSILQRLARLHQQARRWDKAIATWQRLTTVPGLPPEIEAEASRSLGRAYLARSEYDLAIDSFQSCIELNLPEQLKAECMYDVAEAYAFLENFGPASDYLHSVLEISSISEQQRAMAILLLADIYEQTDRHEQAIPLLESIRYTYPNPKVIANRLEYLRNR